MGIMMTVTCGTFSEKEIRFNLDSYATPNINVCVDDAVEAYGLLFDTMNDNTFAGDGCRNEDAVNGCIALHVLGYDAQEWFYNFCKEQKKHPEQWFPSDLDRFMMHVNRVAPYLEKWGPDNHREQAFKYAIHN